MKANGKFSFDGVNLTNSNGENIEVKGMEFTGEVEYSAQELIQLLSSGEKNVHEFLGFLVKDLPNVIRNSGKALIETAAEARTMKREQRLADIKAGLAEDPKAAKKEEKKD